MAVEVTYEDYTALYGTRTGEDAFEACLPFAVDVVRELTWPNEPEGDAQEAAWRRAVCAAAHADWMMGSGHGVDDAGAGSLSVGSVSLSGGPGGAGSSSSATLDAMRSVARRALVGSGLLFSGVGEL